MKKINDKSKIYMIVGVVILIIAIVGSTYAYYRYVLTSTNVNTITRGLDYYINYTKGTDITSGTLNPSKDYTGGNSVTITLNKKDNTYDIYGHIYLDITTISSALSSSNALKYVVLEGTTKISEGSLGGVSASNSYLLAVNIPLKTTSTTYTVYLWFDETNSNALSAESSSVSAKVRCEATMKEINDEPYTFSFSRKLVSIYNASTKTPVTNNSITYQYDTADSLMQDIGGNIRYYGASPNNYIYFNCSDYSNQSSDTCELWRIIGTFDGKVKIIRNDSIGTFVWDNKSSGTGSSTSYYGSNDWTDARLMMLLNPGYETTSSVYSYEGSLYWNSKSGTCYSGCSNETTSCDFTSTGLKNDITRNMIEEVTWNLGGCNNSSVYSNQMYSYERGTTVHSGRPTSWTGKIALMYPSDYGYATDFNKCTNDLYNYNSSADSYACRTNDWLYNNGNHWLLTPHSSDAASAWYVGSSGYVNGANYVCTVRGVRPVLYLSSGLDIVGGEGKENNPYQLLVS